jgi:hypothetical protein
MNTTAAEPLVAVCTATVSIVPPIESRLFHPDTGLPLLPDPQPGQGTSLIPVSPVAAALKQLQTMEALGANWDSYGSDAPTHLAVLTAHTLIWEVYMWSTNARNRPVLPYSVVPLSSGRVQVEWRGGAAAIEVEISSEGVLGYLLARGSEHSREYEEADNVPQSQILQLIRDVI